jgi:hypothetical protein
VRAHVPGWIYTIHFFAKVGPTDRGPRYVAGHYTGFTEGDPSAGDRFDAVEPRIRDHREGRGARLMAEVRRLGLDWIVANVEPGDRSRERQLKKHGAARRCAVCKWDKEMAEHRGKTTLGELVQGMQEGSVSREQVIQAVEPLMDTPAAVIWWGDEVDRPEPEIDEEFEL